MKRTLVLLAVAALLAAAVPARADFSSGATISTVSGSFTDNVLPDAGALAAYDGVFAFDMTANSPGSTLEVTIPRASPGYRVLIYTGAASSAYLSRAVFVDPSLQTMEWDAAAPAEGALLPNFANRFAFQPAGGGVYAFDTTSMGFTSPTVLVLTFQFDNAGDRLAIDAIANPEPGTLALFALGVAGLGGAAWRRRRAQRAQRDAARS
jgi:PEP-CTERM motif-containing protein